MGAVLIVVPALVLLYLGYRVVGAAFRLYRSGDVVGSLVLFGTTIVAAGLGGIFASEKTLLVLGLLSWMFLAAKLIRYVMRQDEPMPARTTQAAYAPEDQDPNSLNFSGVGPGSQGFGLYAGGVRIAHDHFEDD
jgi:hypothetical protein